MCLLTKESVLEQYGGTATNCLDTIFCNLEDDETIQFAPLTQKSTYLNANPEDIEAYLKTNENNFTVLSFNADSLHKKHTELAIMVELLLTKNVFFSAICVQEARITDNTDCDPLNLPGYKLEPKGLVCSSKGGLVTYVHNSFTATPRPSLYTPSRIYRVIPIDCQL